MKKYKAKADCWFKEGTFCELLSSIDKPFNAGIFRGIRVCVNPKSEGQWRTIGEEYEDEEYCLLEEFEVIDLTTEKPIEN